MAQLTEKRLYAVAPVLFTADGDTDGTVKVANAALFTVKQHVHIAATGLPTLNLEVKRITDINTVYVGPITGAITLRTNLSAYTVVLGANISANEQGRPKIPEQDVERATYQDEPVVARRVFIVDELGNQINDTNRLPVDATVTIPTVDIDLDAFSKIPADNVLIVGSEDGTQTGIKHAAVIDSNKNLHVINMGQLIPEIFDSISAAYPTATQEVYTYYVGGLSGTEVAILTVNYTDSSKNFISNVSRT